LIQNQFPFENFAKQTLKYIKIKNIHKVPTLAEDSGSRQAPTPLRHTLEKTYVESPPLTDSKKITTTNEAL
jgi:hypothetical protein